MPTVEDNEHLTEAFISAADTVNHLSSLMVSEANRLAGSGQIERLELARQAGARALESLQLVVEAGIVTEPTLAPERLGQTALQSFSNGKHAEVDRRPRLEQLTSALIRIDIKPEIGMTPDITIVGDQNIVINGKEYEIKEGLDTLAWNLLLERQFINTEGVRRRFSDMSSEQYDEFKDIFYKTRNWIENTIVDAFVSQGQTRAKQFKFKPGLVIADLRTTQKTEETADFLALQDATH